MTTDKMIAAIESSDSVSEAAGKLNIKRQLLYYYLTKNNLKVIRDFKLKVINKEN